MKNQKLTLLIFISLILGIFVGWLFPEVGKRMHVLATIFLNMIKMIIAPLLFAVLVTGIAGHGNVKSLGRLGVKTIVYFEIVTTIALFIGLFCGHIFQPGKGFNSHISNSMLQAANQMAQTNVHNSLSDMITHIFPTSVVQAMASGDLLQIVVFALFFAVSICAIGQKAKPVLDFLTSLSDIMFKFTEFVMYFAPLGVFGAISYTIAQNGMGIMVNYAKIIFSLYFALAVFVSIVLLIACRIVGISFYSLIKAIREPALLAFSTATSEAALPKAMRIMEDFGVPKNIVGFVMPTGYTFNLDGSTLYLSLAVLFSTQIIGVNLTLEQQIVMMLALMLTSKGIAGVPRVSLVVLAGTLSSFGYSLLGVAILLGIDQILDMGRTTVNLIGNCVATVVIARWENEFNYTKMKAFVLESAAEKNIKPHPPTSHIGAHIPIEEHSDVGHIETK